MSIAAAVREAYLADSSRAIVTYRAETERPGHGSSLEQITTWIPTEVVTLYISLLGLLAPSSTQGKWALFAVGAMLVPTFVGINGALIHRRAMRQSEGTEPSGPSARLPNGRLGLVAALALAAFVAWAMALPSTPFASWFSHSTRYGGAAVAILAVTIPKLSELLDLQLPKA